MIDDGDDDYDQEVGLGKCGYNPWRGLNEA